MNGLTYTKIGDYYLPNLALKEQPDTPIGRYGRMRLRYLKEHRKELYTSLRLTEKLYPHLLEVDEAGCIFLLSCLKETGLLIYCSEA
ncbi:MAG: TnpV protein [Lachnospiraceae bacterium]|nr:TnpV protein [Lachnospiraceae bacterium]